MSNNINQQRPPDGPVPTEVAVRHVGAKQRHSVLPELVEIGQRRGGPLPPAQGAGFALLAMVGAGGGARGKGLLDEVCEDGGGAVVGEALAELDEGDGVDVPGDLFGDAPEGVQFFFGWGAVGGWNVEGELVVWCDGGVGDFG